MNLPTSRRTAFRGAVLSLVFPWVVLVFPDGFTVFFSLGYTDSLARFVDILSYTFVYTRGAFWASYWFWHVALVLAAGSAVLLHLGRWRLGGALQVVAAASLLRFSFGLASHTDAVVAPVGAAWMLVAGLNAYMVSHGH